MTGSYRKRSRKRPLAAHEVELWEHVTRHVTPIRKKPRPAPGPMISSALATDAPSAAKTQVKAEPSVVASLLKTQPKPQPAPIKPLALMEAGTRRKLSRGQKSPEAKIDLHGMRQAEAHSALRAFVHRAHSDGLRLVLVVTGKGVATTAGASFEDRGVLRRMTPQWLAAADLRHLVLSFEEASRRHGGQGALYVQLRASNIRQSLRTP